MSNYNDKYKSKGSLFYRDKEKENQPDMTGYIEVTGAQMKRLVEMHKAGKEPRLQLAGFMRVAKGSGNEYMFLSTEAYMEEKKSQPKQQKDAGWDDDIPF